ncbi:MAG: SLBB domain-containing protein, partial [Akkermansiaceae bacterium]|nr:SLBB domain-containing protein [Verrucomicrobiales bacterium]
MSEHFESEPNSAEAGAKKNGASRNGHNGASHARTSGSAASGGFDAWTVVDILARRWHWLIIGGILGGAAFFTLGWMFLIKPKFTATVQLLRYDTPATSEALRGTPLSSETFAGLIASPDLLRRIGDKIDPPIPPEKLVKQMKVDPQPESDLIKVFFAAANPTQAVTLANIYAQETVAYTKELQARQAAEVANNYLKKQLAEMDQDITTLHDEFRGRPMSSQVSNKLAQVSGELNALNQNLAGNTRPSVLTLRLSEKLQTSLAELTDLTSKFTDAHPLVQQKRSQIESLQAQITTSASNVDPLSATGLANIGSTGRAYDPAMELIQSKLRSLEDARIGMANRQREAEMFANDPPGVVRIFAPANLKTVQSNHRRIKTGMVTIFGGLIGMGLSLGLILLTEVMDKRLRTADDLKRVTKLPVLTTLGDLNQMHDGSRTQWAFRTWTKLQGRLSTSQNHGLVCGITSSSEGEGRSTWIKLLAEAASLSGFRVLTIATRPSAHIEVKHHLPGQTPNQPADMKTSDPAAEASENPEASQVAMLSSSVLSSPSQVTEQLTNPNSHPMVHIPLPGWVWNLDRRREWRDALEQWKQIDNLVIFIELPPASVPEAVLLGSNLPNVVWLADSGTADAAETRVQLQTLRDARCNLVGAVLNRVQGTSLKSRFPRWMGCVALFAALNFPAVQAQDAGTALPIEAPASEAVVTEPAPARTNLTFSVVNPAQRAAWQERLTLGPGDILNFSLYAEPTLTRMDVPIAPDGRVSYLEAQDILATGLTVDELRTRVDEQLGKYRRAARCIVTPTAFRSKKYYVLGKVMQRGVYTLDRPTTVIEAIARAKGIENGLVDNNNIDLADYSRSFLMRGGQKIPLDFEKLFLSGDLSQNIQIEPGDYLFFPSANIKQVYVLGEVGLPGLVTYRPNTTVLTAIANRAGFNEKAFKSRVLVVRGSLNNPQTFVVDCLGAINGRTPDFRLEPKDIVYVSHRPFFKAEELLDMATVAF